MALIRITNLRLQTFIGFNPEELINKQEVVINAEIEADIPPFALDNDEPEGIYDYKVITKKMISFVESGRFKLLETLTNRLLNLIMENPMVLSAKVRVDKPLALRFADSVSIEMKSAR